MPMPMYNYYPNYMMQPQNQIGTQMSLANQQQPTMQIQNGGLISVRSEMEARNYPIAPGNSITFKDENSPYVYTKTMGFSQLDRPTFEKFRLVKEEALESLQNASNSAFQPQQVDLSSYALKTDVEALRHEIEQIKQSAEVKHDAEQ